MPSPKVVAGGRWMSALFASRERTAENKYCPVRKRMFPSIINEILSGEVSCLDFCFFFFFRCVMLLDSTYHRLRRRSFASIFPRSSYSFSLCVALIFDCLRLFNHSSCLPLAIRFSARRRPSPSPAMFSLSIRLFVPAQSPRRKSRSLFRLSI